jgi:hypothetical protein
MDDEEQTIYLNLSQRDFELGLELSIVQSVPGKTDYLLSRATFYLPNDNGFFDIQFDNGSKIRCGISYQQCSSDTMKSLVVYKIHSKVDKFMSIISDNVFHFTFPIISV